MSIAVTNTNAAVQAALSKFKPVDNFRSELPRGEEIKVDKLVRIVADIKIGEDYERKSVPSVSVPEFIYSMLDGKLTKSSVKKLLRKYKRHMDKISKEDQERVEATSELVKDCIKDLFGSTVQPCSGSITGKVQIFDPQEQASQSVMSDKIIA